MKRPDFKGIAVGRVEKEIAEEGPDDLDVP